MRNRCVRNGLAKSIGVQKMLCRVILQSEVRGYKVFDRILLGSPDNFIHTKLPA